jgi:7tm Chemosensory receptor
MVFRFNLNVIKLFLLSKIRIDIFFGAFGFKFTPQNFTKLELALWCWNVLSIVLNYTISIWHRKEIFATMLTATYICDIIMWSSPQVTHILLLIEIVRKRKLIRKFWQLIQLESVKLQGYTHILVQSHTKLRSIVLEVFVIYVLLGAVVDLVCLYLYLDSNLIFYFWLTALWSLNGVRIGMSQLFIALEQVNSRLDTIIDLLEAIVLQTRWKIIDKIGIQRQIQLIQLLFVHTWSINDCINRIYDWILLAYTFYVFAFLTYCMFGVIQMALVFERMPKKCE